MTTHEKTCPTCKQILSPRPKPSESRKESLSVGLQMTLAKIYEVVLSARLDEIHVLKCERLNINEKNNFQKLQYFALVVKGSQAGFWQITDTGKAFMRREMSVPKFVIVKDGRVVERSSEKVYFGEKFKDFQTPFWLKREEYIQPKPTAGNVQERLF